MPRPSIRQPALAITLALLAVAASAPARGADTPGSASTPVPSTADRLEKARSAIAAQNYDAALRELATAAREAPRNADVHNLLGYATRKRPSPDIAKAIGHYQTALRLDPAHKGAHEYIGEAYLMDKKPADAERHLAELARLCGGTDCEEHRDLAKAIAEFKSRP